MGKYISEGFFNQPKKDGAPIISGVDKCKKLFDEWINCTYGAIYGTDEWDQIATFIFQQPETLYGEFCKYSKDFDNIRTMNDMFYIIHDSWVKNEIQAIQKDGQIFQLLYHYFTNERGHHNDWTNKDDLLTAAYDKSSDNLIVQIHQVKTDRTFTLVFTQQQTLSDLVLCTLQCNIFFDGKITIE